MRRLILIRHSAPVLEQGVPPEKWRLSDDGRQRAKVLSEVVKGLGPTALFSSDEPKSIETAEPIAESTGLELRIEPGFKEHRREPAQLVDQPDWTARVEDAIRRPDKQVLGLETTGHARDRFHRAVESTTTSVDGDIAIVSHGTVMSMFIAALTGLDAVEVWRGWGLPGIAVIEWPEPAGIEIRWNYGDG